MELLGIEIGAWADFGVAFATLILAFITVLTVKEMRLQQKKDRLQKEMTLLVGPLRSRQNSHFYFGLYKRTDRNAVRWPPKKMYWRAMLMSNIENRKLDNL